MLATRRYAQWRSRFLRYIDTRPNGDASQKCILKGPYTPIIVTTPVVPATENSPAVPEQTTVETVMKMTPQNRAHFESEKEAINLILTGIGDEIYSTVDALETGDSNVIPDSPDMCNNDIQDDQNDVECDDERVALANLKLDVDENKKIQKQLKKANATLTQELTECKSILAETSRTLGESNRLLAQKEIDIKESLKVKDYEISIVKQKHDELVKQSLLTKSHYEGLVKEKTKNDSFAFVHELKQEMHADLKYVESLEDELDELEPDKLNCKTKNIAIRVARKKANVSRPQPRSNQMKDKDSGSRKYHSFKRVYYGRGLNHNLFSVGQFCDADLEVAFQKYTCFVRDLQGNDLLTTSTNQAWFRLEGRSHLNFDYINLLSRKIFVIGLPKLSLSRINYVPILQVRPRSPNDKMCRIMTNPDPVLRITKVYPFSSKTVPSQQELDLLFGPLHDEFFNDGTSRVNKSSSPTDNSIQKYTLPSTHIQPTSEPTTPTNDDAEENNDNQAEFTNPFCTPVQENAESSSRNIGNSNVHTFNQPQDSEYRWTKDHPLTQVRGNPSKPVQTRRQLATDPEMCMFALTVSTAEPKNIKEAMANSAWIEAMQEELHQFDRLQMGREKRIFLMAPLKEEVYVEQPDGFVDPDHPDKVHSQWDSGDKLVSWMSKKQDCTTMSSAEAEYVALSAVVIQVENGIIELYFVRTEFQLADMFTKALFEERFQYLVKRIVTNGNPSSVNLRQHCGRIHKDGDSDALFQLKSDSLPHIMLNLQDILSSSRFKDNHESSRIKDKDFRTNSDIQDLPSRYQVYQGRLLASFQDDAKYKHVGQDTRSQGGKDDQDERIKI
ncbi:hypothetical protein Tco_1419008 [Tanacetum coccineum]